MRGCGFPRLMAGTALALVLAMGAPVSAEPMSEAAISAAVPLPDSAPLVPPTPTDIGLATEPAPARDISAAVPQPEPAPVAPLTPADIAVSPEPTVPGAQAVPQDTAAAPEIKSEPAKEAAKAAPVPAVKEEPKITAIPVPAPEMKEPAKETATVAPAEEPKHTASIPVVTVDQQVGDKLRELLSAKSDRLFERKTRAAVEAFYATRSFAPLWSDNGAANERAKAAISLLSNAEADGLDSTDYPTPDFKSATAPDALAEAELKLTATVLTYARHAAVGRVHYSRVSSDIVYNNPAPEPADVLGKMAAAADARAALDGYNPQHAAYKALKAKLAEARGQKAGAEIVRIPEGRMLKPGMEDPRVALLRQRLKIDGDPASTSYDDAVVQAVKQFQKDKGLAADGMVGPGTLRALNGAPQRRDVIDIIVANLERWRWIAHDLGKAHVIVNIPEYTLRVFNGDALAWQTRIVVGKPGTPTPLLSETMKYITVNPTWNVPPSIVNNEYIPVLRQDPDALARIGLKVVQNRDGTLHIYQPPGERNALGRIRFNFPNKFLVYQHDTPDKNLFAHDKRAYSHGCMRVQNPDKYAEVLLSITQPNQNYSAERIRKMYGAGEQQINLTTPIPVHLTYQTAFVDEAGKLVLRDDIYGRDTRVLAALKGDERKYADVAVERRENTTTRRQVYRMPDQTPNFFLFNLFR